MGRVRAEDEGRSVRVLLVAGVRVAAWHAAGRYPHAGPLFPMDEVLREADAEWLRQTGRPRSFGRAQIGRDFGSAEAYRAQVLTVLHTGDLPPGTIATPLTDDDWAALADVVPRPGFIETFTDAVSDPAVDAAAVPRLRAAQSRDDFAAMVSRADRSRLWFATASLAGRDPVAQDTMAAVYRAYDDALRPALAAELAARGRRVKPQFTDADLLASLTALTEGFAFRALSDADAAVRFTATIDAPDWGVVEAAAEAVLLAFTDPVD